MILWLKVEKKRRLTFWTSDKEQSWIFFAGNKHVEKFQILTQDNLFRSFFANFLKSGDVSNQEGRRPLANFPLKLKDCCW